MGGGGGQHAVTLVPVEVRLPTDIDAAFQTLAEQRAEILFIIPEALFLSERKRITALARPPLS
jgi:hypothetical protein